MDGKTRVTAEPQTTLPLDADQHLVTAHRKRGLFFIGLAVGGAMFALTLQMATNSNFVVDVMYGWLDPRIHYR